MFERVSVRNVVDRSSSELSYVISIQLLMEVDSGRRSGMIFQLTNVHWIDCFVKYQPSIKSRTKWRGNIVLIALAKLLLLGALLMVTQGRHLACLWMTGSRHLVVSRRNRRLFTWLTTLIVASCCNCMTNEASHAYRRWLAFGFGWSLLLEEFERCLLRYVRER